MSSANVSSTDIKTLVLGMIFLASMIGGGFMINEGRSDSVEKDKVYFGIAYVLLAFVLLMAMISMSMIGGRSNYNAYKTI